MLVLNHPNGYNHRICMSNICMMETESFSYLYLHYNQFCRQMTLALKADGPQALLNSYESTYQYDDNKQHHYYNNHMTFFCVA